MKTEVIKIDNDNIDLNKIKYAAEVIRRGGIVAFPTETVYGLGANALNEVAVKRIFRAKGRPADNPLIVHISSNEMLGNLVQSVPDKAIKLMDKFWPGPLTIIMDKSSEVPKIITAGLDTVAIRMPSHKVALALIQQSGVPIAAPSANISGKPSATNVEHVMNDLNGKVDIIIDSGFVNIGLESTVIDVTEEPSMVLRPGGITLGQLRKVLPDVIVDPALAANKMKNQKPKSPGLKYSHYAPDAQMVIVEGNIEKVVININELADHFESRGIKTGVLATDQTMDLYNASYILSLGDREKLDEIATNLFKCLRDLDDFKVDVIFAESFEYKGLGLAIMNRMTKAAGHKIIKV